MPGYDGTGPLGQGALTGRGLGACGTRTGLAGRGFGRGFGRRWIGRRGFFQTTQPIQLSETEEKKILEEELKEIELEKQEIQKRLKELK